MYDKFDNQLFIICQIKISKHLLFVAFQMWWFIGNKETCAVVFWVSLSKPVQQTQQPPPPPAVPTALLIMKRKDFYLMVRFSDPTFRKRKRLFQRILQLVSTEACGEHLCLERLLLDLEPKSTWLSSSPYAISASSVPLTLQETVQTFRYQRLGRLRALLKQNLFKFIDLYEGGWTEGVAAHWCCSDAFIYLLRGKTSQQACPYQFHRWHVYLQDLRWQVRPLKSLRSTQKNCI